MPRLTSLRAAPLIVSLALAGSLSGCNGCGGVTTRAITCDHALHGDCCKTNQDCYNTEKALGNPQPKNYFCYVPTETCYPLQKSCMTTGDCCPGQICNQDIGICVDQYTQCMTSTDCPVSGQICDQMLGSFPVGAGCTFNTCNPANGNADCSAGQTCLDDYCVGAPPCNGGCPVDSACTPVNNLCFPLNKTGISSSCSQSCMPGYILVFTDGLNVFNMCNPVEKSNCECVPLPPVASHDTTRFSDAALDNGTILVSAYDGDYGDLVLHTYNENTLAQTNLEWVDGVPTGAAITGDPNGARGGTAVPGPNVGEFTSIAVNQAANITHIAYYAVADGTTNLNNLKYATRTGTGPWTIFNVDGVDASGNKTANVGMYTSITLAPDGAPVIAYFQSSGVGMNAGIAAVKVARGKVPQPMSASDFTISTIETGPHVLPPCTANPCTAAQVCVSVTTAANGTCVTKDAASACTPPGDGGTGCSSSEVCGTATGGMPTCYTPLTASTLATLPDGTGLFTGIAYLDTVPVVVWYDSNNKQLKGIIAHSDSPDQGADFVLTDIKVLDDGTTAGSTDAAHDVGRYGSIAIGPTGATHRIAVAYVDETVRQLKLITADAAWANLTATVVDPGIGSPTTDAELFVGSDSSVKFVGNLIQVVYQDQTTLALRYATQTSSTTPVKYVSTLSQDSADGFYARLVVDGTNRFASEAVIKAASASVSGNTLQVLKLP